MPKGSPIYNPDVQSDIDMKNTYKLINYPASTSILSIANTIYVDSVNGSSGGQRGTSSAFQNLTQALAVAQNGDAIVFRPGTQVALTTSLTTSLNNLFIIGYGATLTANAPSLPGGGWFIKFTGTGCIVEGLTLDGNRGSNTTEQGWGLIESTAASTTIRNCVFQNALGAGVRLSATGIDRAKIVGNEFNATFSGIISNSLSGSGEMYFQISGNRIHDSWATSGKLAGAIKLQNAGSALIGGDISLNTTWNWPQFSSVVGIELQGGFCRTNIVANQVRGSGYAITLDGGQYNVISDNVVSLFTDNGIEMSAATDFHASDNTIEGAGTGNGYLIADTGGTRCTIKGGSVSNCATAISAFAAVNTTIEDVDFYNVPAGVDVIYLHDCPGPVMVRDNDFYYDGAARALDALNDGSTNETHLDFVGNRLYGKPTSEVVHYNHTSSGTISDCDVVGNIIDTVNNLPTNGFVNDQSGGTIRQRFNSPINLATDFNATDSAGTIKAVGKISAIGQTGDYINSDTVIYNRVSDALTEQVRLKGNTVQIAGLTASTFPEIDSNKALVSKTASQFRTDVGAEYTGNKGVASGYASLDGSGKVPAAQLPTLSSGTIASTSAVLKGDGSGNAIAATQTGTGDNVLATSPTLITPTIGAATATSVNKWTLTAPSTAATITAGADNLTYTMPEISTKVGFRHIPQNSQSANYTTVLNDSGKHIYHPAADANARTFTIDSNANVAYPIGTAITFANLSANTVTIAITSDTMYLAGTGTTGNRSLAQYGTATALKTGSTEWVIQGVGLS